MDQIQVTYAPTTPLEDMTAAMRKCKLRGSETDLIDRLALRRTGKRIKSAGTGLKSKTDRLSSQVNNAIIHFIMVRPNQERV